MKKLLALALVALFALSTGVWFGTSVSAQDQKVVALDLTPGRVKDLDSEWGQENLQALKDLLTSAGYQVKELTEITPQALQGVDALVIGKMKDYDSGFSSAEVQAIADWFKQGGKFLWVGADSDYVESYLNPEDTSFKAGEPNKILEAIGSSLRLEYASLEDPESNAGAGYRVISYEANSQGWAGQITAGAPRVLFHGPTFVVGYKNGQFVPFSEVDNGETVTWLYRSSPSGTVVSHDGVDPKAHAVGETGQFVEAAAEKIKVGNKYSKVIVTGESLLGDRVIITPEYHGVELQGATFAKNAFAWGLTVESAGPAIPMTYIAIAVVVIVVIVGAALALKKK